MENSWRNCTLGDAVNLKRGYDLPTKKRVNGKYAIYASNGIGGWHNEFKVEGPGVITGRSGTLGKVFYSEKDFWPLNTSLYVQDFKGNDKKFIYYFLQTLRLENYNAGSGVPTLNRNHVHLIQVKIPSLEEQQKIASILSSLDDKIKINNEMNKTLEEMAQAIFKSCFVDFKPFKDGEFEESELGMIPNKWRVETIDYVGKFKNGKGLKKELRNENGKYIVLGSNGEIGRTDEILFDKPVITIGRVGANYGEIHYSLLPCWVSDNAVTTQPIYEKNFWFLLNHLLKIDYSNFVGGSAQPLITQSAIKNYKVVIPPKAILDKYNKIVEPMYKKIQTNNIQIVNLSKLRDTLLPKLISGEIRIN